MVNPLKKLKIEQVSQLLNDHDDQFLADHLQALSFQKSALVLDMIRQTDVSRAGSIFSTVGQEGWTKMMENAEYPVLINFLASLRGLDDDLLRQAIRTIPKEQLIREEELGNLYYFNQLLYTFFRLEMEEEGQLLVGIAESHIPRFVKTPDLRTYTSFLELLSNYSDIKPLLDTYGKRLFGAITRFAPTNAKERKQSSIPRLIGIVARFQPELAHKLLKHVHYLSRNEDDLAWGEQAPLEILAYCNLKMAGYHLYNEEGNKAEQMLQHCNKLFTQLNHDKGLALTYFQFAKLAKLQGETTSMNLHATRAQIHAQQADWAELVEDIQAFMKST